MLETTQVCFLMTRPNCTKGISLYGQLLIRSVIILAGFNVRSCFCVLSGGRPVFIENMSAHIAPSDDLSLLPQAAGVPWRSARERHASGKVQWRRRRLVLFSNAVHSKKIFPMDSLGSSVWNAFIAAVSIHRFTPREHDERTHRTSRAELNFCSHCSHSFALNTVDPR